MGLNPSRCSVLRALALNLEHKVFNDLQSHNQIEINLFFVPFRPTGESSLDKRLAGLLVHAADNGALHRASGRNQLDSFHTGYLRAAAVINMKM